VLKILAFQERHYDKDAYDLVYTLVNYPNGGPPAAGRAAATSPIREDPRAFEALRLLKERFINVDRDGPNAYANFFANPQDTARRRNEAASRGLKGLIRHGLLDVRKHYKTAPLSPVGYTADHLYTLQQPFGPKGRTQKRRQ